MISQLRDGSEQERCRAARALGRVRRKEARTALADALSDTSPLVRWAVSTSLGRHHNERYHADLMAELGSNDPLRRAAVVDVLGFAWRATAKEDLLSALQDRDSTVRLAAAEALGRISEPDVVSVLSALAGAQDEESLVRYAALEALGKVAPRVIAVDASQQEALQGLLAAALREAHPLIRAAAARTAGRLRLEALAPDLEDSLRDPDIYVRWQAVQALGRVGNRRNWQALKAARADAGIVFGDTIAGQARRAWRVILWREERRAICQGIRHLGQWSACLLRRSGMALHRGLRGTTQYGERLLHRGISAGRRSAAYLSPRWEQVRCRIAQLLHSGLEAGHAGVKKVMLRLHVVWERLRRRM